MSLISKELNPKGAHSSTSSVSPAVKPWASDPASSSTGLAYKSRIRQEPTNVAAPQWAHALWSRLTSLVEDMAGACVKVSSPTLSRRSPQWLRCPGLFLGESFEDEEGPDLADCFPRRGYEGGLNSTTASVN
jgi:hypothetical protein